jgi:hypothetical protein
MPSTESELCRPPIPMSSEKWSTCRWNGWSAWLGTSGRHPSESMVGMGRNMHDTNEALVIKVTGETGHTVRWVATVRTAEVMY